MMQSSLFILGVDPGTRITGYGIIELLPTGMKTVDFGCIRPPSHLSLPERYHILFESLETLLDAHPFGAVAVESQFVFKNPQSAIKLGMAKGMALLAAARKKIPVHEYAPKQAKQAVVGTGQASKHQVQRIIQTLLHLPELPEPEDAADALALAICCAHHLRSSLCMSQ